MVYPERNKLDDPNHIDPERGPVIFDWRHPDNDYLAPEDTMNIGDAFPSKYLKASDLQGREVAVTISHVEMTEIDGDHGPEDRTL